MHMDPLFRNTRENRDNTREKIFEIYNVPTLFRGAQSKLMHSREVRGATSRCARFQVRFAVE